MSDLIGINNMILNQKLIFYRNGFFFFKVVKIAVISHGKIFHYCIQAFKQKENKYILINLFRSKPFPINLAKSLKKIKNFLVVDEQTPSGNLSSCVFEGFRDKNFFPKIISKSLPERYFLKTEDVNTFNKFGLSKKDILKAFKRFLKMKKRIFVLKNSIFKDHIYYWTTWTKKNFKIEI